MKYLVTGGAGFIGSHIAETLVNQGQEVIVLDNMFTGLKENMAPFLDKIKFVKGDICDKDLLMKEFKDVDFVLHQAARRSVPHSLSQPLEYNETNINGTVNILEAAKKNNVKRVILASSSSVYGDNLELPQKEGSEGHQLSPYALTKLVGEKYLKLYYELYGLETVSLRYFNVFGARQDPDSQYSAVIPIFTKLFFNDKRPTIFDDGEQTRDFTFIANIVEGNLKACTAKKAPGESINIANGDKITVNKLFNDIRELMDKQHIEPIYTDPRAGDIKYTMADNSKAKKLLGYEGKVSFNDGLKETIQWFNDFYSKN